MNTSNLVNELIKFDDSCFVSYEPIQLKDLREFETATGLTLPLDFKNFLLITNGASINCHELYGIKPGVPSEDLYDNYNFETKEVGNPMPYYYLPIYPDGMGNHNCLDLKSMSADGERCNVIFWQHDRLYEENELPDVDAASFTEFLEKLLKEM